MCMCKLLVSTYVWSPADPAISCLIIDVVIFFVHMSFTYCLFTVLCQPSVIGHNIYGMSLCIVDLDVTMFFHVCFLSLFISVLL